MPPSLRPATRLAPAGCITTTTTTTTTTTPAHHPASITAQQVRHATLIRRPKRPYTFTQLITLSDGSTFLHRTTSPLPVYASARDTRNTPLWNPSNARMANVEEDEAGRLRAFRRRFGRAFDSSSASSTSGPVESAPTPETKAAEGAPSSAPEEKQGEPAAPASVPSGESESARSGAEEEEEDEDGNLMDLLNSYAGEKTGQAQGGAAARVVQRGAGVEGAGKGRGKGRKK